MGIQLSRVAILKLRLHRFTFSKEWACALALAMAARLSAQTPLTWDQVKHLSQVTFCAVSSGFNRVMGLQVVRGRWLMEHEAAPAVVMQRKQEP